MKKQVLVSFIMVLNVTLLSAQIKVSENGNVGIKSPAGDVLSVLSVNSLGDVNHTAHINSTGKTTGLRVNRYGTVPNSGWGPAVDIQSNLSGSSMIFGLLAYADKDSQTANPLNSGRAFGVCGVAGNSTSGWNFGVVGTVRTTQNGVGIFGADNSTYANGTYIDGRYAGYFKGNVKVTGTINGTTVGNSDIRYKQNIVGLGELSSSGLMTKAASRESKGQNTPNPFTQSTGIRYYLPETVTTASLCIYDMQGKQLKQIALTGRGDGAQLISASQLTPGMYLYALIADGQEVDVKRMILTE